MLARQVFASGSLKEPEEFRFYLSGGFKAAIPYLIGLAEAVRSVDRECLEAIGAGAAVPPSGSYPVKAFMLHESATRHPSAETKVPTIELPLRRLVARAVRSELSDFKDGRRVGKPRYTTLEGYAYEITGGGPDPETCELSLTPFGVGLQALFGFGFDHEGLGQ